MDKINKQPKSMTSHKEHKADTKPQKEQNNTKGKKTMQKSK